MFRVTDNIRGCVLGLPVRARRIFSLRMAPMIDIIFLLLIFFLVAAKWRPAESFLPFKLPVGAAGNQAVVRPEPLVIEISATQKLSR